MTEDENQATVSSIEFRAAIKGIKIMATCFLGVLTYYTARTVLILPRFEEVFSEMLPDPGSLPKATEFVLTATMPLLFFIIVFPTAGTIYGFTTRHHRRAFTVFGILSVAMIILYHNMVAALFGPLRAIVQGMSGS